MNNLYEILEESPRFNGGKWAIYGENCLWWTSYPEDCGSPPGPLLRCPHCGGLLDQKPLLEFIENAVADPVLYGPGGLLTLVAAHHRNIDTCYENWDQY